MKIVYDNVIFENNRSGAIIQCSIPLVSFCVCVAAEGYTLASSHGLIAAREYTRGTGKKQHPPRKRTISTPQENNIHFQKAHDISSSSENACVLGWSESNILKSNIIRLEQIAELEQTAEIDCTLFDRILTLSI